MSGLNDYVRLGLTQVPMMSASARSLRGADVTVRRARTLVTLQTGKSAGMDPARPLGGRGFGFATYKPESFANASASGITVPIARRVSGTCCRQQGSTDPLQPAPRWAIGARARRSERDPKVSAAHSGAAGRRAGG